MGNLNRRNVESFLVLLDEFGGIGGLWDGEEVISIASVVGYYTMLLSVFVVRNFMCVGRFFVVCRTAGLHVLHSLVGE